MTCSCQCERKESAVFSQYCYLYLAGYTHVSNGVGDNSGWFDRWLT